MLTLTQAKTLFDIVSFANKNFDRIPTGPEFAKKYGISDRGALDKMNRILDKADFVIDKGKSRFINYDMLITEKESAKLCLLVHEIYQNSTEERATTRDIASLLNIESDQCRYLLKKCCDAGYISHVSIHSDAYRPGIKMGEQLEYIKLIAEQDAKPDKKM